MKTIYDILVKKDKYPKISYYMSKIRSSFIAYDPHLIEELDADPIDYNIPYDNTGMLIPLLYSISHLAAPEIVKYIAERTYNKYICDAIKNVIRWTAVRVKYGDFVCNDALPRYIDGNYTINEYCKIFGIQLDIDNIFNEEPIYKGIIPEFLLYMCIRISHKVGNSIYQFISQICNTHRNILSSGHLEEYDNVGVKLCPIPVLYAMEQLCDVTLIQLLKDAWWNPSYSYKMPITCISCMKACKHVPCSMINIDITTFINQLYSYTYKEEICKKYAEICNTTFTKYTMYSFSLNFRPQKCNNLAKTA